jgi:hypothetical protein
MATWHDSEDRKKSALRSKTDEKGVDAKDSGVKFFFAMLRYA